MFIAKLPFPISGTMFLRVVLNVETMRAAWELMFAVEGLVVYGIQPSTKTFQQIIQLNFASVILR